MSGGFDYTFKGLDDQSIINAIIKGTGLPECPIDDYSEAQLRQLVPVLINVIRSFIAKEANISEPDIQEWIDSMCFKAKKDSKTSSMRPSSDMYRATATAEQNEASDSESDECPASNSQDRSAGSHSSENQDEGNASSLSEDDQEKKSEEELRKDHNRFRFCASHNPRCASSSTPRARADPPPTSPASGSSGRRRCSHTPSCAATARSSGTPDSDRACSAPDRRPSRH